MSVLVFAPHPDDDVIGCGGSIVKHVEAGRDVCVVYLTSGDAGSRDVDRNSLQKIREAEARSAAEVLGVTRLIFLRHADGQLGDSPELVRYVVGLLRERRPRIVYLPHRQDAQGDHIVTHRVVMKALSQASGPWFQETGDEPWTVPAVLAYEVWTPITQVQYLEDITEVAQRVRVALSLHKSQLANIDYEAMSTGLANYRGTMLGPGREAEAFAVIRVPTSLFHKLRRPHRQRTLLTRMDYFPRRYRTLAACRPLFARCWPRSLWVRSRSSSMRRSRCFCPRGLSTAPTRWALDRALVSSREAQ